MSEITLHAGDNRAALRRLIDQGVRVHSVVTDPPYGLVSVQKRFGKDGSAPPARTAGNDGSFARLSGGFMGKCFHPDTEILTDLGWRKVSEVTTDDVVATLNPTTRDIEWQEVEQTHAYPFEGRLVHVKHRSAEQVVTPNHRIVISKDGGESLELVEPHKTGRRFHLFAQGNPIPGKTGDVTIQSEREYGKSREIRTESSIYPAEAFFRFFGMWLGDGYTVSRKDDHPANDFFGISVKKSRKKIIVRETLTKLGVKFTETENSDGFSAFYCYDFVLLGFLKALGGSKTKSIPLWMFDRDASDLEHLYQGLMETDGCRQGKNQEVYYTCSRQLADDFQRLCLHTGRSSISVHNSGGKLVSFGSRTAVSSEGWTLCVLQPGKRMYAESSNTRSNVVYDLPYEGNVYCIGVPKHHIIYTRFNGKPVWSGNSWDATGIERDPEFWRLIHDILLPGGYCFAFGGARTVHWQAVAMEMAGFVIHPLHAWAFGSGFPKAHAADKAIDKMLGLKGQVVPTGNPVKRMIPGADQHKHGWEKNNGREYQPGDYEPASDEAAQWSGWAYGTQTQKPAIEPIVLAQRPFSEKTGAANLLKHGVGAVNIDGCRVPSTGGRQRENEESQERRYTDNGVTNFAAKPGPRGGDPLGRHPANLLHDGSPGVVALFPDSKGQQGAISGNEPSRTGDANTYSKYGPRPAAPVRGDGGSAARFFNEFPLTWEDIPTNVPPMFYHRKANKGDREGSKHPTVKPVGLLQHLIRHITPPGGVVLDPFAGSGTTAEAAIREGFDCILMEQEPEYVAFLRHRFDLPGPQLSTEVLAMLG